MAPRSDLFACDRSIFIPPIDRALIEELDRHLRECPSSAKAVESGEDPQNASSAPSPSELAGSLKLIGKAAQLIGNVQRLLQSPYAPKSVARGLDGITRQTQDYEELFFKFEEQLRCAFENVEIYKQRSQVAEKSLEMLMSAVSQNLACLPALLHLKVQIDVSSLD